MRGSKTYLILILIVALFIMAGCDNRGSKCTAGESCVYYSGTEGIRMYLENPPNTMYYRTEDRYMEGGNEMEINVMVENKGASDSRGAVFLAGFPPEVTQMSYLENGNEVPFRISNVKDSCYFDFAGFDSTNSLFGLFSCGGISGQNDPNSWSLNFDFGKIAQTFGWNLGELEMIDLGIGEDQAGTNFRLGIDGNYFNVMVHGKSLAVMLMGLNFRQFNGAEFNMKGDHADNPGGDMDFKTFRINMWGDWPAGQDYFRIPYQVKSCYGYTTFVSPMLCVDPDPFSAENKICTAETYTWGGSQGSPVAVTRLEQTNTGKELVLDFTIRNVGNGEVWDAGYLESCSPYFPGKVRTTMKNVVYVGPAVVGSNVLDCSNRVIRLNNREGRFTCRYDFDAAGDVGSAYTVPLKMELWYGYEENINRQVTVRRVS